MLRPSAAPPILAASIEARISGESKTRLASFNDDLQNFSKLSEQISWGAGSRGDMDALACSRWASNEPLPSFFVHARAGCLEPELTLRLRCYD
ncbi:hypothetical protein MPL3356_510007 [Mesorhizobium plurifarium]|uniref:Uncharacterized protein n=1 Tax=Mesorhizobium plurifarium TaxID=69974 RepID=A0A090GVW6_MESPL|nr:hypothetical protein MPL3356_510007 [Mesorhizobium plurifarium]CDX61633.1 hypothetical protein MPL3365_670003 [Mesorhizobium plurifarium]